MHVPENLNDKQVFQRAGRRNLRQSQSPEVLRAPLAIRRQNDAGKPFFVWLNMTHMPAGTVERGERKRTVDEVSKAD